MTARRAVHVLTVREGGEEWFWTGDRWSPEREGAKEFATYREASQARAHLDSDRDVLVLVFWERGSAAHGRE